MAIDYRRSELECLIDLIRQDNQNKALSSNQVTFGVPNALTPEPEQEKNTVIVATAIPDRGFLPSSHPFYYTRLPLSEFVDPASGIPVFNKGDAQVLSELLPQINEALKINLTPEKIFDQQLPAFEPEDNEFYVDIQLKVRPTSLVYLDAIAIRIVGPLIPLPSVITELTLPGLTYAPPVE